MAVTVTRTAPPSAPTGFSVAAINGWDKCYNEESGALVDRTTEFTTTGSDVDSFAADDDYVYFSVQTTVNDDRVADIHIVLSQAASVSIEPVFEYSTGDDSWATLTVTDGTNGFTQDGTISVDKATFPKTTVWLDATKDGSGNTVGDGVARRYIRIKRTVNTLVTPPKISESGSGFLSASTTYYYKAVNTVNAGDLYDISSNSKRTSVPTSEVSVATTTVKRTIEITINTGGNKYVVWRTPTSGDYAHDAVANAGYITGTANIDSEAQTVKGRYFDESCGTGGADSSLIDNGLAEDSNYYHAVYGVYAYYKEVLYLGKERGNLVVTTDGGSVADFYDIWQECQTNGWTDALVRHNYSIVADSEQRHKIYELNDNLDIQGDFSDKGVTLFFTSAISTYYCDSAIFGRRVGSSPYYTYDTGVNFILTQGITFDPKIHLKNSTFYSCKFVQACINQARIYARFPLFEDNCKLYDCMLDGFASMELPSFLGDNLILENVLISQTRYGLTVDPTALATITMSDLTIQGNTGIYNGSPYWSEGQSVTFNNFTFKSVSIFLKSYNAASNDSNVTLNFVNPTLTNTSITTALGGQNWLYNEQYAFDLNVIDSQGNAISGATVVMKDIDGTTLFTVVTDASGDITQQTVTYKQYTGGTLASATYHQYYADDVTTYSPHTITITKSGYQTKTIKYTMDQKRVEVEKLENRREV